MLYAPFPYFGGKRRYAEIVWEKFGHPDRYIEPFAGSMAILLANPDPCDMEIANDLNGYVANFWRSVTFDPEETAYWSYWPSSHIDLTARQSYLYEWRQRSVERLTADCHYYDAKIAGYWCWGVSNWIGTPGYAEYEKVDRSKPHTSTSKGGRGVQVRKFSDKKPRVLQRRWGGGIQTSRFLDKVPHVGGQGTQTSRFKDKVPSVHYTPSGRGVHVNKLVMDSGSTTPALHAITVMMFRLSERLSRITFFCRDWTSFTSPTVLGQSRDKQCDTALFLDPPYLTKDRSSIYQSDLHNQSDSVSDDCYEWAVENGEKFKIAFCATDGDYPLPSGWTAERKSLVMRAETNQKNDIVMFSPKCETPNRNLFE